MSKKVTFNLIIATMTPKKLISRMTGFVARLRLPAFILRPVIAWYCNRYGVNTGEILFPPNGFESFDHFFTRKLKEGIHRINESKNAVISPVDGRIDQFGAIYDSTLMQAKGRTYRIEDLVPSEMACRFRNGSYITLYLSPADYHRIHSPADGKMMGYHYVPGTLFSVQRSMVERVDALFCKNERLISYLECGCGLVAVCKIGAMNVGRITLSHPGTATGRRFRGQEEYFYPEHERPVIKKGSELGVFHLGSTVVTLFQEHSMRFDGIRTGQRVRMGEKIALILR